MPVKKYSIELDVESSMTIEQLMRKIDRLDSIETFVIRRRKIEIVSHFPKVDKIVEECKMPNQPWGDEIQ